MMARFSSSAMAVILLIPGEESAAAIAVAFCKALGKSAECSTGPELSALARSRQFSISRMLPGQS